jgi:CHAT domain-containing protein
MLRVRLRSRSREVRLPQRGRILAGRWRRACAGVGIAALAGTAWGGVWDTALDAGIRERGHGNISESVRLLEAVTAEAPNPAGRLRATRELALSLVQAGRLEDADKLLQAAHDAAKAAAGAAADPAQVAITLALGNVAAAEHDGRRAADFYQEALAAIRSGGAGQDLGVLAQLNLLRLQSPRADLDALDRLYPQIAAMRDPNQRAEAFFSLGAQAAVALDVAEGMRLPAEVGSASPAAVRAARILRMAYRSLSYAAELAQQTGDEPLQLEAADAIAQLYETEGRFADAMQLNQGGLALAQRMDLGQVEALLVRLEWRAGRLHRRLGDDPAALASYLRAARHLEAIRHDLPIEDDEGQSTYQTLLKPIFTNLLDLMLQNVDGLEGGEQPARLGSVLDALELTHQAEMQDYLGDRCSVDSIKEHAGAPLDAGVAVLYTVVLEDRLEVVARTNTGLLHHSVPIPAAALEAQIKQFRTELTDPGSTRYLATAQRFYGWLVGPFEAQLASRGIHELVFVPDGYLRLVPFAALHDGRGFVAERYAVSTITGLTMTETGNERESQTLSLLAGLSSPGPVVNTLISMGFMDSTPTGRAAARRAVAQAQPDASGHTPSAADSAHAGAESALRSELALPGVDTEIRELTALGKSKPLMNGDFTVGRFQQEVATGRYRLIHIASHGFFGDNARDSFLLAFDDLIRMDDLQRMIADNGTHGGAIELLTLSACETAEGNDRAPLGFAGAAIRARARSVVGTLWSVSDDAASRFMEAFYAGMERHGKAQAFAEAQRSLIGSEHFSHPFFWAPIVLIGNWN